jgi:hypothetical protein
MNRLPETVSNKFSELFSAMNTATDDLKMAGADALLLGDFAQVGNITDACRQLQMLEMEIKAIVNNIDAKYTARTTEKPVFYKNKGQRTRKPGSLLRVTVAGKVIEEPTIKETFVKTLRTFGLDRVAKLNKTVTSVPLLARTPVNGYQNQRRCDGWFITTHVNMYTAKNVLEEIGKQLNMPVKVEFIER